MDNYLKKREYCQNAEVLPRSAVGLNISLLILNLSILFFNIIVYFDDKHSTFLDYSSRRNYLSEIVLGKKDILNEDNVVNDSPIVSNPEAEVQKEMKYVVLETSIARGDTLYRKMMDVGFTEGGAHVICKALNQMIKLSQLQLGTKIVFVIPDESDKWLQRDILSNGIKSVRSMNVLLGSKLVAIDSDARGGYSLDVRVLDRDQVARIHENTAKVLSGKMEENVNEESMPLYYFHPQRLEVRSFQRDLRLNDGERRQDIIPEEKIAERKLGEVQLADEKKIQIKEIKNIKFHNKESKSFLVEGKIASSFVNDAYAAGVPRSVIYTAFHNLKHKMNFQKDLGKNAKFQIIYSQSDIQGDSQGRLNMLNNEVATKGITERKKLQHEEDLIYIKFITNKKKDIEMYRYVEPGGKEHYWDSRGDNIKKSFLLSPVKHPKISSGFGIRKHPIYGEYRMHHGVDFKAKKGTPIFASGDGIIEYATYLSGYGKCIKIKHNQTFSTLYAHLDNFALKARRNYHVKQGEVIGFVGSTGASTAPHLHYELQKNGKRINPLKAGNIDLEISKLSKVQLNLFQRYKEKVNKVLQNDT